MRVERIALKWPSRVCSKVAFNKSFSIAIVIILVIIIVIVIISLKWPSRVCTTHCAATKAFHCRLEKWIRLVGFCYNIDPTYNHKIIHIINELWSSDYTVFIREKNTFTSSSDFPRNCSTASFIKDDSVNTLTWVEAWSHWLVYIQIFTNQFWVDWETRVCATPVQVFVFAFSIKKNNYDQFKNTIFLNRGGAKNA